MKSIKSESMTKIRDEEEKRKETQAHFQKSINDIFATLGKNNDENLKIKEANLEMTKKFKYLAEQYELREKQMEKLNEQIKLETQLNEAKLAKVQMESTIEREILLKEKQAALEEILSTKKTLIEMESREKLLKVQLHEYADKYDEFHNSLQKSNGIFSTYKTELEKMAKKIKSLEKESYEWRVKYEKCNRALLNTVTDKQAQDQYVNTAARQIAQLQKLCRTLQSERSTLLDVLKTNNIERPVMPELPPEPKDIQPAPKPTDKLDAMSRNCKELKETLAQLQGQMNAMTLDQKDKQKTKTETTTAPSNKKSKTKKNKTKPDVKTGLVKTDTDVELTKKENSVANSETTDCESTTVSNGVTKDNENVIDSNEVQNQEQTAAESPKNTSPEVSVEENGEEIESIENVVVIDTAQAATSLLCGN